MTYCVAISTSAGIVFCSDSRTNAGPDVLSTYSKMHVFQPAPDRLFTILSAGNLATTQSIIARVESDLLEPDVVNLANCKKMIDVARYLSTVSREEQSGVQENISAAGFDGSATLIIGGQIEGAPHAVYLIYAVGNFITDSENTPYLQIGESKYGKPILDRIINRDTPLDDAVRCAVVSMDSTLKSNATVGPPIELMAYETDSLTVGKYRSLDDDDEYLRAIRSGWSEALHKAFATLPDINWEQD